MSNAVQRCSTNCGQDTFLYHDTPSDPLRTIRTHNSLAHNMAEMLPVLENVPQWSMQAFDAAREKLHPQYPNTQAIPNHGAELQ